MNSELTDFIIALTLAMKCDGVNTLSKAFIFRGEYHIQSIVDNDTLNTLYTKIALQIY